MPKPAPPSPRPVGPGHALAGLACLMLAACGEAGAGDPALAARVVAGGDAEQGRAILDTGAFGCGGCHAIPGIVNARGSVGPPLHGLALRGYLAGRLTNTPDNLVRWITEPQAVDPRTAMPDTGIGGNEARHVAAYLYTLRVLP